MKSLPRMPAFYREVLNEGRSLIVRPSQCSALMMIIRHLRARTAILEQQGYKTLSAENVLKR